MEFRAGLYYSKDHEWVRIADNKAYVGITDYAQHHLGDIVFVELPDVDQAYASGSRMGVIESVKAVSDINCPVSGRVLEVNSDLEDAPETVNKQPYEAWIAVLDFENPGELNELMNSEEYAAFVQQS